MRTHVFDADGKEFPLNNDERFLMSLTHILDMVDTFFGCSDFLPDDELLEFIICNIDAPITDSLCHTLPRFVMVMHDTYPTKSARVRLLLHSGLYIARRHRLSDMELSCRTLMMMYGLLPLRDLPNVLHDPRPAAFDAKGQCFLMLGDSNLDLAPALRYFYYDNAHFIAPQFSASDELAIFACLMRLTASDDAVRMGLEDIYVRLLALRFICMSKGGDDPLTGTPAPVSFTITPHMRFLLRGFFARLRCRDLYAAFLEHFDNA